jgi:hypothetical protein
MDDTIWSKATVSPTTERSATGTTLSAEMTPATVLTLERMSTTEVMPETERMPGTVGFVIAESLEKLGKPAKARKQTTAGTPAKGWTQATRGMPTKKEGCQQYEGCLKPKDTSKTGGKP